MRETATDDPVFGRLVWDGFQHSGWGGSFADPHYSGWGSVIESLAPDKDDDEDEAVTPTPKSSTENALSGFLSIVRERVGKELDEPEREAAKKMIDAALEFEKRVEAYDGSLDAGPLRKAGRLKVVIPNPKERTPTPQQQDAWRAFCAGGADLAEQVAVALLSTYQRQRTERVRWWRSMYDEPPDTLLPIVNDTKAMRAIVRPKEFAVPARPDGETCIAIVFESFWSNDDILVRVRDGRVIGAGAFTHPHYSKWSQFVREKPQELDSPVFGRLRRERMLGGWNGVFHSDHLCGFDDASKLRYRYRTESALRSIVWRPMPSWDTITGDFEMQVHTRDGARPTLEQEEAFRIFNADPAARAQQVLSAIFDWYRKRRVGWLRDMRGDPDGSDGVMPVLKSPEGLLEIIQLQSVCIMEASGYRAATGPREMTLTIGPKAGKKIPLPPLEERKAGVAIVLSFHWEDEHGLAVRWRNGKIETVGDWESAAE